MRFTYAFSVAAFLVCATPAYADEYVMMKINNQDVSSSEVQRMWEGVFPEGKAPPLESVKPEMRERLLRALLAEKLIYAEAVKAGADKSEKLVREMEEVKKKLVTRRFLEEKSAQSVTDADLRRAYDKLVASTKDEKEVRARHILVATEQEAKDARKKIDGGKSFEDVARELSKDPGSAGKGGDLGYFTRDKMVKEFADVAFSMKKGEVSAPVKSGFGYHLIKVEDSRKLAAPTFNESKDKLRAGLQEEKLNEYVGGLVKSADVKVFDAKGKDVPFEKDLMAPPSKEVTKEAAPVKPAKSDKPAADAAKAR